MDWGKIEERVWRQLSYEDQISRLLQEEYERSRETYGGDY